MRNKPKKPYDGFPLFPHTNGQWVKKIRGKLYHFGPWADWSAALNKYQACRDALYAGRTPRQVSGEGITIKELCNLFLTTKKILLDAGQLSARTMEDYRKACERVIESLGHGRIVSSLDTIDFERLRKSFPKTWGLVRAGNTIQHIRTIFKFAYDEGHIDRTLRFGQAFRRPNKKSLRKVRQEKGKRLFESSEIRLLIEKANPVIRAMILLGINCGFGNNDCATLTKKFLDLKNGGHCYGRPKTGVERHCPLWPETVKAIREASKRKKLNNPSLDELVFVTKYGKSWHKETSDNPISIPYTARSDTFSKVWNLRVIRDSRRLRCTVGISEMQVSIAVRKSSKQAWYLP